MSELGKGGALLIEATEFILLLRTTILRHVGEVGGKWLEI